MDFVLFMFFSVLEAVTLFYFMFRLFKFDMYYVSIIFAGLIMAFISYTMREVFHNTALDVVLQFFLILSFVWLMFRVHLFYAGVMTGIAYIGVTTVQTFIFYLANAFGLLTSDWNPFNIVIYLMQISSCLVIFLIGHFLHRKNIGFDFVPHSQYVKVKLNKRNRIILLLYIPIVLSIFLINLQLLATNNSFLLLVPALLGIVLFSLLFWSYKRDRSDD